MADAAAGQVSPHPVLFPFRMVSSAPSARLVVLLAYTLLYFSGTVSTADVPDTSSSCANEGWEAYDPRQVGNSTSKPRPLTPLCDRSPYLSLESRTRCLRLTLLSLWTIPATPLAPGRPSRVRSSALAFPCHLSRPLSDEIRHGCGLNSST